jgi:hypothetical protein
VRLDEVLRLDEHASGTTTRVIDPALVRLDHFDEELDDAPRRVELAAALPLLGCELADEVLVYPAEEILLPVLGRAEPKSSYQINQFAETSDVETGPSKVLGENPSQGGVLSFNGIHSGVDDLPDVRLFCIGLEMFPTSLRWHPEDPFSRVLVSGLQQLLGLVTSNAVSFEVGSELCSALAECIIDVLEKDEPQDYVFVLAGVHGPSELVCCLPEGVLEAERIAVLRLTSHQATALSSVEGW